MANPIKLQAEVTKIVDHCDDVFTVYFKPLKKIPQFKAGQFLHLTLNDYDPSEGFWPESRVFSIASAPKTEEVIIVYSVKGVYTSRMKKELEIGKKVWLKLPYGSFTINAEQNNNKPLILIAGGTGISPYLSYIFSEQQNPSNRPLHLVYGVRKMEHVLFPELLRSCYQSISNFKFSLFVEMLADKSYFIEPVEGRISIDYIYKNIFTDDNPSYFLSGPPAMIKTFKKQLMDKNVPVDRIIIDEWE